MLALDMDPFAWRETVLAVVGNLLVPLREGALDIREGEFEKDLKRRSEKHRGLNWEEEMEADRRQIARYFEQFRKKKLKFEQN